MNNNKNKHYFRKPRSEIVKDIFKWLAIAGMVYIAASSPYFTLNLIKEFKKQKKHKKRYKKQKIYNSFYNLQKQGYISIERMGHRVCVSLTEKGRKKLAWLQVDGLKIKKPKKWDKKWRIIIFDISQLKKIQRNAFRGKLEELNFRPLQKSVWIHPYDCRKEVKILREFFGLGKKEVRLIVAEDIENDSFFKKMFKLN